VLPSLADLLTLPAFAGAEVVSGQASLGQPITWVHVSEIVDAARFLTGGELLLSTGAVLTDLSSQDAETYLHSLVRGGAHGLVLELVRQVRVLPPALLAVARAHDFPLIVYRQEVSFAQLTRAAHARILQPPAAVGVPALTPLLDALHETGRSLPFMEAHLGPLLSLPPRPRTTLMQTLGALLESNFNVAQAARRLGVRRQSIYYRLEQLRAMLGDLEEPSRHIGLHLALAIHTSAVQADVLQVQED